MLKKSSLDFITETMRINQLVYRDISFGFIYSPFVHFGIDYFSFKPSSYDEMIPALDLALQLHYEDVCLLLCYMLKFPY